mgnify:FL=1|nr:MAG TPA: hypothetical protein [Caudoviricetes sp.]
MRLSDVKGERTFEVVADIIEPVYRIAQDEAAVEMLSPKPCPEGEDPKKFMARRLVAGVPALLRSHKGDLVAIMAAIEGEDAEEYAASLDLAKLVVSLTELVSDPALMGFLASAAGGSGETPAE